MEIGYRSWSLKFTKKGPRLGSIFSNGVWEPNEEGEVTSSWKAEEGIPFEETTQGLYSLKLLKDVNELYADAIRGSIIPIGKTAHGEHGYRSEKAKVKSLSIGITPCYICSKPAKYYVKDGESFCLCEECFKRLKRLLKAKGHKGGNLDTVLRQLARIYDAEIEELDV